MATESLLICIYYLATSPLLLTAYLTERLNLFEIKTDIEKCTLAIDGNRSSFPSIYIDTLVAAEDRRYRLHPGVDLIAITRAILATLLHDRIEGASTIEQQFARVITGRHEHTFSRKIREQIIAICLRRKYSKIIIAQAYLAFGQYGYLKGKLNLLEMQKHEDWRTAISLIARLKCPEPKRTTTAWSLKLLSRMNYIEKRLKNKTPEVSAARTERSEIGNPGIKKLTA